ncbi:hypothetical protein NDU88_007066 [Pleurodeles waltl]|uniref:Uncharacterized protein n=1 Tax=Pleurodeles waltl TaxID=8319 RepID=A0AAV7URC5_PLEWA|nr:hypothetical protein NDU88_007066 [Pleurodeles waltl]
MEQEKSYMGWGKERKCPVRLRDEVECTSLPRKQTLATNNTGPKLDVDLEELLAKVQELLGQQRRAQESNPCIMDAFEGMEAAIGMTSKKKSEILHKGPRQRARLARTAVPSKSTGAQRQVSKKNTSMAQREVNKAQTNREQGGKSQPWPGQWDLVRGHRQ